MIQFSSPACECNAEGAINNSCADGEGQCTCKPNITGDKCDKCAPGFFGFPDCQGMFAYTHRLGLFTL